MRLLGLVCRPGAAARRAAALWMASHRLTYRLRPQLAGVGAVTRLARLCRTNVDLPALLDSQYNGSIARRVLAIVDEIQEGGSGNRRHTNRLTGSLNAETSSSIRSSGASFRSSICAAGSSSAIIRMRCPSTTPIAAGGLWAREGTAPSWRRRAARCRPGQPGVHQRCWRLPAGARHQRVQAW